VDASLEREAQAEGKMKKEESGGPNEREAPNISERESIKKRKGGPRWPSRKRDQ